MILILLSHISLPQFGAIMANSQTLYQSSIPYIKQPNLPSFSFTTTMAYSKKIIFFLFSSLLLLHVVSSVEFTVVNKAVGTPGGVRFDNEIGVDCSKQIMVASTDFIWKIFQQSSIADRKNVHRVSLFIVTDYDGVAFASNNEIHVSASYIANYGGDVKREITGKYK